MGSMPNSDGWRPLSTPATRAGAEAFRLSPFARLARSHVFAAGGDALVTIALANSLFFDLDPNQARWRVFLYLALTMAPLALVAPFIGPALDRSRGGRRWMIVGTHGARALVCLMMLNDLDTVLLFPEAFAVLALGKAYGVARCAVVPTVVHTDDELVEANAKMQLLSGVAAPLAAVPAGIAFAIGGSSAVVGVATVAYLIAAIAALRVPATQVAEAPATEAETAELRGIGIVLASSAMGLIRGIVGFLTFLLLFDLREDPTWHMGVVLLLTGVGALLGSVLAPAMRRSMTEERMLASVLAGVVVVSLVVARVGGLAGSAVMAAAVAVVSTCGKLAFDSLVQRDAPDANRGRSFARFELRFQLVWVVGAVIPVLASIPLTAGFLFIAGTAAFALFSYLAGQRAAHRAHVNRPPAGPGIAPDAPQPADASTRDLGAHPDPTWLHPGPGNDPTEIQ